MDVVAYPCPDVVWSFNGIRLGPSNETFKYNNACLGACTRGSNWRFTLDVVLTESTSGKYNVSFTNIGGITSLPKIYITIPGMPEISESNCLFPCTIKLSKPASITNLTLRGRSFSKDGSTVSLR